MAGQPLVGPGFRRIINIRMHIRSRANLGRNQSNASPSYCSFASLSSCISTNTLGIAVRLTPCMSSSATRMHTAYLKEMHDIFSASICGFLRLGGPPRYRIPGTSRRHTFHDSSAAASHESFHAAILRAERAPST
jgi:hypothetical protein